jgi:uncharacterized oxidoreductase
MQMRDNTILITGGGSGIGRGLAEAFHALGNQVIIAGRRKQQLESTIAANPGMKAIELDVADPSSIRPVAEQIKRDYPALNVVIHNARIMKLESLRSHDTGDAEAVIATNLLGPIRLNAAILPLIEKQHNPIVMTVSSGLAFVPAFFVPTYCATKAAIHSYTQTLRYQLQDTAVQVIELIPPYVQTELLSPEQATDPNAMPLHDFISEVMQILKSSPDATEICVDRVKRLRFAQESGSYGHISKHFNDSAQARYQFRVEAAAAATAA